MAVKHSTEKWNLKKYAKMVLFKGDFAAFSAQKEAIEPTTWVQHPPKRDQKWLFIILVGSNAHGPLEAHARHPNCLKKAIFGHC